ncbi:hypothetical protein V6Z11_A13G137200 [Gossypium hirsutum]
MKKKRASKFSQSSGQWPSWLVLEHHCLQPHVLHVPSSEPLCLAIKALKNSLFLSRINRSKRDDCDGGEGMLIQDFDCGAKRG